MNSDVGELLRQVRALVEFQGELKLRGAEWGASAEVREPKSEARAPMAEVREAKSEVRVPMAEVREAKSEARAPIADARSPHSDSPSSTPSFDSLSPGSAGLQEIRSAIGDCTRCKLCKGRTNLVFGVGNPQARLMFVGEGPGRDEDLQGEPFVGAAGQLLNKMIQAMGLARSDVYIANVVKCRPPQNRDPEPDEVTACEPFLRAQIRAVKPEVIVGLGRYAVQTLLRDSTPITRMRGKWREYESTPLMPTYHPAYLLRNPAEKRPVWQDLQNVMTRLGGQSSGNEPTT